jgi:rfaE bifunctional protein nucleotidyltransferase chain/domain/rfaE bifunctional protein kinase chain/domain
VTAPLVILGDLLLDIDLVGSARRLSPEAPVPVLSDPAETARPGGAGLAALLAARAHERVVLIAPLADDDDARRLLTLLPPGIELIGLPWAGSTSVKTRVRAGDHPLTRIDRGGRAGEIGALSGAAIAALDSASAILVADYGLGLTSSEPIRTALRERAARTPIVWDPHPRGAEPVAGVRMATPNSAEAAAYLVDVEGAGIAAVAARAQLLMRRWSAASVAVTMGSAGALLVVGDGAPLVVPAPLVAASDTCGAGDAFAVAAAVALAGGAVPSEAVAAAVGSAAAFVAAGAAAALDAGDRPSPRLRPQSRRRSGVGGGALPAEAGVLERVRAQGGRVVATGGCFDLLHAGHVATLEAARALGDCLVVCLNSDDSVRRLKGPARPLQQEADRARMLSALRCVDLVVVFDEDTPEDLLRTVRPDVWVKGADYLDADLPEARVLAEWNGTAVTVPYLTGRSTTDLLRRSVAGTGR